MNRADETWAGVVERDSSRWSAMRHVPNGMNFVRRAVFACAVIGATTAYGAAPPAEAPKTTTPAAGQKRADKPSSTPPSTPSSKPSSKYITQSVRGKVVWISEALSRQHGVRLDADAAEALAALETPDGELLPIMKEDRGRGFWKDQRLRGIELELQVRRYKGVPLVQVLRVYRLKDGKKVELDYWCEVCAIQMFELKQCECCQGPTILRERPMEK